MPDNRAVKLTDDEWKLVVRAMQGFDGWGCSDEELDMIQTIAEQIREELNK